ncbi:MAG: hypothetical protein ACJ77E_15940 [Gaiellaceae bacterium]
MPFGLTWRRILVADAAAASVAAGIAAAVIERGDRADAFAGTLFGTLLELAAGWALAAAGLVLVGRRRHSRTGVLMALGGIAWFLPEWSSPSAGGAVVFTIGLAALAACSPMPPLHIHVAVSAPWRGLHSRDSTSRASDSSAC